MPGLDMMLVWNGGGERTRTVDLLLAKQALSQLSYTPRVPWAPESVLGATSCNLARANGIRERTVIRRGGPG